MAVRCPVCGEELEGERAVRDHEHEVPAAWQGAGAGFECPECGARFDEQEELVAHQATHASPGPA
jgi:hypothetical protein